MRRQLAVGAAAVTAAVVIAFVVPLALAVRTLAADRALDEAEHAVRALAAVLAVTPAQEVATPIAAAAVPTGARVTVYFPDGRTAGAGDPSGASVAAARGGAAVRGRIPEGGEVVVPAYTAGGATLVVRAVVPAAVLRRGVARAWSVLGGLSLGLVLIAVGLADWLGRGVVRPARALADGARRLAGGALDTRVEPAGPPEVADVGRALNALAERISALVAAERELVADLSHRLRTPLTALRLDAEALADDPAAGRVARDVAAVERAVDALIREARTPRPGTATDVDVADLVAERAAFWSALAEEQQRVWRLDVATPLPAVRADPAAVAGALDALLDNVFAHTPEGTGYRIEVRAEGQVVCVSVHDAGPGFADPQLVQRGASGAGSTGLGLDIARRVAERTGGRLTIDAPPGGGTRATLVLGELAAHGDHQARRQ